MLQPGTAVEKVSSPITRCALVCLSDDNDNDNYNDVDDDGAWKVTFFTSVVCFFLTLF